MGGMFGESKFDILQKIPPEYVPPTIRIEVPVSADHVLNHMALAGVKLPAIFKPDIGERGFMVKRVSNKEDILRYLESIRGAFLIQELVTAPAEFGVFYMRLPRDHRGQVISVVAKEMLSVTGDGRSTLRELIMTNDRAKLQWKKLKMDYATKLDVILEEGEKMELVSIGNHAQGTRFINANQLINERLSETFHNISSRIPGFYFGRFDLRCNSVDDLYEGNVKIMELNGCGAEPAHIYDTEFSLWRAFYELIRHWNHIFRIARENNLHGTNYMSHKDALAFYRKFKTAVK